MTRQFILMTDSPLIYWILDATAERDTQILMQFIYRNQAIILTIDPAIRLQVLSHNLSRPTVKIVNGVRLFSFRLQSVELSRFAGLWGFNGPFVPG